MKRTESGRYCARRRCRLAMRSRAGRPFTAVPSGQGSGLAVAGQTLGGALPGFSSGGFAGNCETTLR